jgi:hypothetical protein
MIHVAPECNGRHKRPGYKVGNGKDQKARAVAPPIAAATIFLFRLVRYIVSP